MSEKEEEAMPVSKGKRTNMNFPLLHCLVAVHVRFFVVSANEKRKKQATTIFRPGASKSMRQMIDSTASLALFSHSSFARTDGCGHATDVLTTINRSDTRAGHSSSAA